MNCLPVSLAHHPHCFNNSNPLAVLLCPNMPFHVGRNKNKKQNQDTWHPPRDDNERAQQESGDSEGEYPDKYADSDPSTHTDRRDYRPEVARP